MGQAKVHVWVRKIRKVEGGVYRYGYKLATRARQRSKGNGKISISQMVHIMGTIGRQ